MKGIQFLLMTGLLFIGLYFFIQLKRRVLDLILFGLLITVAVIFIVRPDLTNRIAKQFGVGRGADLLFYIAILIFWFVILKLFARIRKLEKALTHLVRSEALANVSLLPVENNSTENEKKS